MCLKLYSQNKYISIILSLLGNRIINFVKGIWGNSTGNSDWWGSLNEFAQKDYSEKIKLFNKRSQNNIFDIETDADFSALSDDIKTYFKNVEKGKASVDGLNKAMSANMKTVTASGVEFVSTGNKIKDFGIQTKTAMKGFGNVVKNGLKSFGVAALGTALNMVSNAIIGGIINSIVSGVANLWDNYSQQQENAIQAGNEALQSYQENLTQFNNSSKVVSDVGQRFEELRKGVSSTGDNIGLTTEEYDEYLSIASQLASTFPELVSGYDSLGNPIIGAAENVRDLTEALHEQQQVMSQETLNDTQQYAEAFNAKVNQKANDFTKETGLIQQQEAVQKLLNDISNEQDISNYFGSTSKNLGAAITSFFATWGAKITDIFTGGHHVNQLVQEISEAGYKDTLMFQDIAEAAGIDPDILKTAKKNLEKASEEDAKEITEAREYINQRISEYAESIDTQLNQAFTDIKPLIESTLTSPGNNAVYNALNDSTKDVLSMLINNMDFETGQSLGFIDEANNLDPAAITKWGNNIVKALKSTGAEKELDQLFSIVDKKDSMTLKEYEKSVDDLISSISTKVPELSKDLLESTEGVGNSIDNLQEKYKDLISGSGDKEYKEFLDNLSNGDLETLWTLNAEDVIKNAEEARKALYEARKEAEDINANPIFDSIAEADDLENAGADYEKAVTYLQEAKEMYDKGLWGTDDFKTRAAYLSPTESDDPANFIENYQKAVRYLTEDGSGVQNFLNDLESKGLATFETLSDGTQKWSYNLGDLNDASQQMGIGFEFMMDMFGRLEDYGFHNNFFSSIEEGREHLSDLSSQLAEEEARLAKLTAPGQYDTSHGKTFGNQTAIDASLAKIDQLKADIHETGELMGQIGEITAKQYEADYEAAKTTIQSLADARKQILADPNMSDEAKGYVVKQLEQEAKELANQYDIKIEADLDLDTSELDEVQNKTIQIKGDVDLSEGRTTSTESLQSAGWEASEGATSLYKSYTSDDKSHSMVITPVLPDGTVLTPDQTQQYVNDLFSGKEIDPDIKVTTFVGEDAETQAQNYSESINAITNAIASGDQAVQNYFADLQKYSASELEGIDFADGQFSAGEESLENFMNSVGVSTDKASEFIDVLRDMGYIGANSASEVLSNIEGINFDTLKEQIQSANDALQRLGKTDTSFDISTEDISSIENQITEVMSIAHGMQDINGNIDLSVEGAQDALTILSSLIDRKQELEQPAVMTADISGVSEAASTVVQVIQQWQTAYNELQKLQQLDSAGFDVDVDISNAQANLDSLTSQLQSLSQGTETAEVMASISIDPSSADPATIASQIGDIQVDAQAHIVGLAEGDQIIEGTVNYTVGESPETVPDAKGTANFDLGESPEKVPNAKGLADFALGDSPDTVPDASGRANYYLGDYPTSLPTITQTIIANKVGFPEASGTMLSPARASGTAYNVINTIPAHANGSVSLPKDEKALVNELGTESLIRDGKWMLIPGGMHFENLKKGDIVLNAQQTADLLNGGKAFGHGKAYADGTLSNIRSLAATSLNAYAVGSGGGILGFAGSGSQANWSGVSTGSAEEAQQVAEYTEEIADNVADTSSNVESVAESTEDAAEAADEFKEIVDYIEIAIDRVEREISNIERTAESAYNTFSTRNSAIQREMAAITKEIDLQQQAYSRYIQEANSVGLSEDYASKVRNGTIDIETITDETLADNIKSFQDYYEKVLDARDATEELKESIKDLYQESFDNIVELYDGIISQIDHERQMIESDISQLESKGHINTSNYYRQLIDIENKNVAELLNQREKLIDSLNSAVNSGDIKEYSSAWYDMKSEINDVDEAIQSANESLIDYNNSLRDIQMDVFNYYSDQYDQIMSKYDHRGNTLENKISLDETGGNIAQSTDYDKLISNELDKINVLINKRNELTNVMSQSVSSGLIKKESDEWYEMQQGIDEVSEAIQEANINLLDYANSIEQIQWDTFERIADNYDNILSTIDNKRNTLDSFISQTEDKGYLVSAEYYEALIKNEKDNVNKLTKERNDLIASMNKSLASGNLEKYSDVWYDMQQEIDGVSEALQEANSNLIEYSNAMRDLEWEVFDKIQDSISGITDESDFLIDLMSNDKLYDEKGKVTDKGKATIGLHGVNYNTYMAQADEYRKEMEKIQKELAKDPYNYELIDRRKELLELQRESILAAEDEKEAIRDLIEDGINKQLDTLQELIDKYTDAMDTQKDLYDYQKEMEERQSNISSLEKQLSAYQGDNSEEGALKRQDLQNQLDEAKSDLEDSQYEKSISETKKLLDDLYSQYELILNMRLDNIDLLITEVIANVNAESAGIRDTIVSQATSVGYLLSDTMKTIWGENSDLDSTLNNNLIGVITTYGNNFTSAMTGVQTAINNFKVLVQDAIKESQKRAEEEIRKAEEEKKKQQEAEAAKKKQQEASKESSTKKPSSTPVKETVNKPVSKPQQTTSKPASTSKPTQSKPASGGDGIPKVGDKVTFMNGWYYVDSYGSSPLGNQHVGEELYITYMNPGSPYPIHLGTEKDPGYYSDLGWVKLEQIKGYKKGIKNIQQQQLAWTQEGMAGKSSPEAIIRKSDGAVLMPLNIGDAVLTNKATENLWNAANNPTQFIQDNIAKNFSSSVPKMTSSSGNNVGDISINIAIDKVQDYNDFIKQLRADNKFEKLIQSMSVNRLLKNDKLNKYSINI